MPFAKVYKPYSLVLLALVVAVLVHWAAVAYRHYFFVPRVFIFLLAGRALLLLFSADILARTIGSWRYQKGFLAVGSLVLPLLILLWLGKTLS